MAIAGQIGGVIRPKFWLLALFFIVAKVASAQTALVTLNTAPLSGHSSGPFYLEFQLTGSDAGANTIGITGFNFYGGQAVAAPLLESGASGDVGTGFTLRDGQFVTNAIQKFMAGPTLQFTITMTSGFQGPAPDEFSFAILDANLKPIPTLGPGNELLSIDSRAPLFSHTFAADPFGSGPILSAPAVTWNPTSMGPVITGVQPQNQTVIVPETATFSVTAIGTGPISYQWNKNGVPINGATAPTYTTPPTTAADHNSKFTVTVRNTINSFTTSPANLTVSSIATAPVILSDPQYISVSQGKAAAFYVIADGTAPLSYEWARDGIPIAGAKEATYTTQLTTIADTGARFTVTVTNRAGSVVSAAATLNVSSQVYGNGGFQPLTTLPATQPGNPDDIIGARYRLRVVENASQSLKIIFGGNATYASGSAAIYHLESNVYSGTLTFPNGGCTTWPPLGTYAEGVASLRNATADYPYSAGQQSAPGTALDTNQSTNWPVQTYLVDNIPNLWKSDSISQFNLNGLEAFVTIRREGTLTNISPFVRCGLTMLAGTYRVWSITTEIAGHPAVVNRVIVPDASGRYILPSQALQFYSEFLHSAGAFRVQYWNIAYLRESNPAWTLVSTFTTMYPYDGDGQDFGVRVVGIDCQNRIEFSSVPGTYLPGNLPFSFNPAPGFCQKRPSQITSQ